MANMAFTIGHDPESSLEEPFLLVDEKDGSLSWWPTLDEALDALRTEAAITYGIPLAERITVTKDEIRRALKEAYAAGEKSACDYLELIAK